MTRRLVFSYLSLMLLVLLALEVPFGFVYARGELSRFSNTAEQGAMTLADVCEDKLERGLAADLPELARNYSRRTGSRVIVADRNGIVRTDTDNAPATTTVGKDLSAEPDMATALHNRPAIGTRDTPASDGEALFATVPGSSGTDNAVTCVVRTLHPLGALTEKVHTTWAVLAALGLGVLAIVTLIGFALARSITRPIRALERATAQLADGRLTDPPATDHGPPELRRLSASFTRTATRLQHLLRAQQAFASEASHQLKTPLTALRLRLENFEPHLAPGAQGSLDEALAEVERLSRMVQGLLALARLENSAITPEATDLDTVVADRAAIWTAFAGEQGVDITVTGAKAGHVWAVPGALDGIIDNLLSNALRASPPGTAITLTTVTAAGDGGRTPPMAELHVVDEGPGMTEAERRRAFDRFWRAADAQHEGTGLGLPMVRQLTRACGGKVSLHAAPGGGLDAVVRLRPARRHAPPTARRPSPDVPTAHGSSQQRHPG
ncbi:sensor histidine kinase [Streptomyces gilvosporeus]|uniref:Signal transduction histidine-protein kinase/phosphatase MprB n=1 Tax=Streptomyces gilvosporeus TaxID=553510 RepID=A0A1V0TLA1_9ACTN|nr:HAMP domain-containing sensor histidine kinase [Streptomyces gilvosporeus]ARF53650.1 two-component sensor histidine kinase [Streptomyces gilvosporeus]